MRIEDDNNNFNFREFKLNIINDKIYDVDSRTLSSR